MTIQMKNKRDAKKLFNLLVTNGVKFTYCFQTLTFEFAGETK